MNRPSLSIITLTKNRASLLEKNFTSLVGQVGPLDEIIVIDNGSTDDTRSVIRRFKSLLPITAKYTTKGTYPRLYNLGIRYATGDIVVFLDDDCIASPTFIEEVRRAHIKRPGSVIQGMSESIPKGNIYAEIMGDHYRAFLAANTLPNGTLRILDNKNASLPRTILTAAGAFDESMTLGSEDIELGIRLRWSGIPIFFEKRILAYHHERTTFRSFVSQHMRFARSEGYLDARIPKEERLGIVGRSKGQAQLLAAARRETQYLMSGDIIRGLQLPFLYLILATVRIWGYATSQ